MQHQGKRVKKPWSGMCIRAKCQKCPGWHAVSSSQKPNMRASGPHRLHASTWVTPGGFWEYAA